MPRAPAAVPGDCGVSRPDQLPHGEAHVLDAVVALSATGAPEFAETGVRRVEPDHALELGDRDEQRAVGVAVTEYRVDLEDRMSRVRGVDACAVVDDALEDGQSTEPHATMLADDDRR